MQHLRGKSSNPYRLFGLASSALLLTALVAPPATAAVRPVKTARIQPSRTAGPTLKVVRLEVEPKSIRLSGVGDTARLVVTAVNADGTVRDVSHEALAAVQGPAITLQPGGRVVARRGGSSRVQFRLGSASAVAQVEVRGAASEPPVSYSQQVFPLFSRAGCSQGICHGNANGKGGLKLSLRGQDAAADYEALLLAGGGRRINRADPARSLLLLKPSGGLPHLGGLRMRVDSDDYRLLARWIAEGARSDLPAAPTVTELTLFPAERVLYSVAGKGDLRQQLRASVRFSDGSTRDVTELASYESSDETVTITPNGLVEAPSGGDAGINVRYGGRMATARLTFVPPRPAFTFQPFPQRNLIDQHVLAKLRTVRLQPSALCDDSTFLRRATLDTLGRLPTVAEVREFLAECAAETKGSSPASTQGGRGAEGQRRGEPLVTAAATGLPGNLTPPADAERGERPRTSNVRGTTGFPPQSALGNLQSAIPVTAAASEPKGSGSPSGYPRSGWRGRGAESVLTPTLTLTPTPSPSNPRTSTIPRTPGSAPNPNPNPNPNLPRIAPKARAKLIDKLLQQPEFADFWVVKWADLLRAEERSLDPEGMQALYGWLRESFRQNKPLDQFVRELLTSTGSTYDSPATSFFRRTRTPDLLAENTAQLFMGVRMACARCHNHPYDRWQQADYHALAAYFARVGRETKHKPRRQRFDAEEINGDEIVVLRSTGEWTNPATGEPMPPGMLGDPRSVPPADAADRRTALAAWLTGVENPYFAKAMVNRVWYHLMGRGIVDPVDDFRESNPPTNPALLDALSADFARNGFDLRRLVATILSSSTYQLSAAPNAINAGDAKYFSHALSPRLTAEQLFEAIAGVTGAPETFPGYPPGTRLTQVVPTWQVHPFLRLFGQPPRETVCECERSGEPTLGQSFELIGGREIDARLRAPENRLSRMLAAGSSPPEMVTELYLAALSRPPAPDEQAVAVDFLTRAADRRTALEDLVWTLINTKEFLLRH